MSSIVGFVIGTLCGAFLLTFLFAAFFLAILGASGSLAGMDVQGIDPET
jgi:hypothetical protein